MNVADVLAALELPFGAHVDQRVPKKLLLENGATTAADRRRITDGIEEIRWLAALKPTTVGVPKYRDEVREYLEIAVIGMTLRPGAKVLRLTELTHRAVPYPVWLVLAHDGRLTLSLAHKRWAQKKAGKTVLDGKAVEVGVDTHRQIFSEADKRFFNALSLTNQRRTNLMSLYQSWIDTLLAWQAACLTGVFAQAITEEQAAARRDALVNYDRLTCRLASLRLQATRESQIHRLVELNAEIKRIEAELAQTQGHL